MPDTEPPRAGLAQPGPAPHGGTRNRGAALRFLEALRTRALAALAGVVDPELGLGIVDLGLVRELRVDGDTLTVVLTPTSAACPMTDLIADEAQAALDHARLGIPATLELRWDPPWSLDWMSERARRVLGG